MVAELLLQLLPAQPVCDMPDSDAELRQPVCTMHDGDTELTQMGHTMLAVDTVSASISHTRSRLLSTQTHSELEWKAVVCDHIGSQNVDWIRQAMEVDIVGHGSPRHIGESWPWLKWIFDNYDTLPSRVFFSHGHQVSWHCKHEISDIMALPAAPVTFVSDCTWEGDGFWRGWEMPGLDSLHLALFNRSWQSWWNEHNFWQRKCCSENVATSASIRRIDRRVYQELLATIVAKQEEPWGWIFERTWQSLFEAGPTGSSEEVVEALRKLQEAPTLGVTPIAKVTPIAASQRSDDWKEWTMPASAFKCSDGRYWAD